MNTDVDILRRQLEDLQAANARLQGERDQFRDAYTQLRLEQAPTRHERHQIQSDANDLPHQLEQCQEMTRNYEGRLKNEYDNDMAIDFPTPKSQPVSREAELSLKAVESRPCSALPASRETSDFPCPSTPVVKLEPPSPRSSTSPSLLSAFARQDTPPPIIPSIPRASSTDEVKPIIRNRKLVPHVEISTRPPPGYVRDVSNIDILEERPHKRPHRKAAANHKYVKREMSPPVLEARPHKRPRRKAAANHKYVKRETSPPDLKVPKIKSESSVDEDRKPKKKDEQSIIIPLDFIESLLRGVPALAVPKLLCKVRRDFLTSTYGCAPQGFYGYIAPLKNPTGVAGGERRMLAFPSRPLNPAVPSGPGKPGLIFSVQHKMLDHTASLFVKETADVPLWTYYGEYNSVICAKMEKKLWMMQTIEFRTSWARKILKQKMPCYLSIHARIKLRKTGRAVTDGAVSDLMQTKSNQGLSVSDVLKALDKGEEALDIIRMKCVSYDEPFLHHVYARSRHWNPDDPFSGALTDNESSSEEEDGMSDMES